ncbi:uncharacterized protein [Argopecten irradians]|uniref:uncharacterized protein isoform X2 n=1 Tax=Argopecten irradians TaxID=31199 RepID=UPI00371468D9
MDQLRVYKMFQVLMMTFCCVEVTALIRSYHFGKEKVTPAAESDGSGISYDSDVTCPFSDGYHTGGHNLTHPTPGRAQKVTPETEADEDAFIIRDDGSYPLPANLLGIVNYIGIRRLTIRTSVKLQRHPKWDPYLNVEQQSTLKDQRDIPSVTPEFPKHTFLSYGHQTGLSTPTKVIPCSRVQHQVTAEFPKHAFLSDGHQTVLSTPTKEIPCSRVQHQVTPAAEDSYRPWARRVPHAPPPPNLRTNIFLNPYDPLITNQNVNIA